jgi:hypothetical protein
MKRKDLLMMAAATAAAILLTSCGSASEAPTEPEKEPALTVREVTAEEAAAYRAKLATASKTSIAVIMMEAPNDELRQEAEKRRDEIFKPQ